MKQGASKMHKFDHIFLCVSVPLDVVDVDEIVGKFGRCQMHHDRSNEKGKTASNERRK